MEDDTARRHGRPPTWHARGGRLTPTKRAALDRLDGDWGRFPPSPARPIALEIGAGSGEAALALALGRPDLHVVATEVHAATLARFALEADSIGHEALGNLTILRGDGRDVLDRADRPLVLLRVFFPDPWPKHRHRGRRLVTPEFAATVAARLDGGGVVELATDDAAYAAHARAIFDATPGLRGGVAPRADRPVTHYEALARSAGRAVVDLRYEGVRTPG